MWKKIAFTGGGTAGHIFPGLAVCDELKSLSKEQNQELQIFWIGNSRGMDKKIVESACGPEGVSADKFYGIPSGKLRRYFSFQNFLDLFKIFAGFVKSFFILLKIKPDVLFSKGGFVSVPPCLAARLLKIPVFTHECDFSVGLANRINCKSAKKMLLSYEETKKFLGAVQKEKAVVTGNPVRPVFYKTDAAIGKKFLGLEDNGENKKPVLLVLGGSSGAKQINTLVKDSIDFLCTHFTVVHQTGLLNTNSDEVEALKSKYKDSYKPYQFIYDEMPHVVACSDLILSRAGANSIWECADKKKPMILVPLCGNGTRGDQVDNAEYFENAGCAKVLLGEKATKDYLEESLSWILENDNLKKMSDNLGKLTKGEKPALKIAKLILEECK